MKSSFSTPMPSFLETPTETAYEIIYVTERFSTDFQKFKASTTERIDKIVRFNIGQYYGI